MPRCSGSNAAKLPFFSKSSHVHGFSSLEMPETIWRHGLILLLGHHPLEDGLVHVPGLQHKSSHAWLEMIFPMHTKLAPPRHANDASKKHV